MARLGIMASGRINMQSPTCRGRFDASVTGWWPHGLCTVCAAMVLVPVLVVMALTSRCICCLRSS